MVRAAYFFGQLKDLAVFGFGVGVFALVKESVSQTAVASYEKDMVDSERFLFDRR